MNIKERLINSTLIGITVATLGLTTGGNAAEAKVIESAISSQPQTQLVAVKFKKLKKHHKRHSFKKAKRYKKHHGHKGHHNQKKFFGHKKFYLFR